MGVHRKTWWVWRPAFKRHSRSSEVTSLDWVHMLSVSDPQ